MLVWDGNSWGDEEKRPQRDGSGRLASLLEIHLVDRGATPGAGGALWPRVSMCTARLTASSFQLWLVRNPP